MKLTAPDGSIHTVEAVRPFIASHPELFAADDALERYKPSGAPYSRAEGGLRLLIGGKTRVWKGWHRADDPPSSRESPPPKKCVFCSKEFTPKAANSLYCSPQCRSENYAVNVVGRSAAREFKCDYCGKLAQSIYSHARFCGKQCSDAWHHEQKPAPTLKKAYCAHCGKGFARGAAILGGRLKYCSPGCKDATKIDKRRLRNQLQRPHVHCRTCGTITGTDTRRKYCPTCAKKSASANMRAYQARKSKAASAAELKKIIKP